MDLHVPTCRRHYPGGPLSSDRSWDGLFQPFSIHPQRQRPSPSECKVGVHIGRFEACSTFTCVTACRLAASPKRYICLEGSDGFVTSTAAPIATGWSDPVAGWELHPLKSQHLFTAHTRSDPAETSPQELLRPASWLALLSRTFTFELAPTRSPSISVEYDYVDKQSIPTAGLSPASPTALWAAGHRNSPPVGIRNNETTRG